MNERILVNEGSINGALALDQAQDTAQVINIRLIPALEAIGQSITDAVLKDCFSGAKATRKTYFDAFKADIKGTRTPSIVKQMTEAANEAFEAFERELSFVRMEARNYKFLTIEAGQCVLTPENQEKLLDQFRIYITDPKEVEAYKLHVEIVEKLNQLFKGRVPYLWHSLFVEDPTGKICRNDGTSYSRFN